MTVRPAPRRGVYDAPFWSFVEQGQLHLQRCCDCGRCWFPPGPGCPDCLSEAFEWTPVSGTGTVASWATFRRQYFESLPPPYTIVAAELAEGPILIADLVGQGEGIALHDRVDLCYDTAHTADGAPFMIYHWKLSRRTREG